MKEDVVMAISGDKKLGNKAPDSSKSTPCDSPLPELTPPPLATPNHCLDYTPNQIAHRNLSPNARIKLWLSSVEPVAGQKIAQTDNQSLAAVGIADVKTKSSISDSDEHTFSGRKWTQSDAQKVGMYLQKIADNNKKTFDEKLKVSGLSYEKMIEQSPLKEFYKKSSGSCILVDNLQNFQFENPDMEYGSIIQALVYIQMIQNSNIDTFNFYNAHRLLAVSLLLSIRMHGSDYKFLASEMAQIGIETSEIIPLEKKFFSIMGFNGFIHETAYIECKKLIEAALSDNKKMIHTTTPMHLFNYPGLRKLSLVQTWTQYDADRIGAYLHFIATQNSLHWSKPGNKPDDQWLESVGDVSSFYSNSLSENDFKCLIKAFQKKTPNLAYATVILALVYIEMMQNSEIDSFNKYNAICLWEGAINLAIEVRDEDVDFNPHFKEKFLGVMNNNSYVDPAILEYSKKEIDHKLNALSQHASMVTTAPAVTAGTAVTTAELTAMTYLTEYHPAAEYDRYHDRVLRMHHFFYYPELKVESTRKIKQQPVVKESTTISAPEVLTLT
jgi:hypothetical protein